VSAAPGAERTEDETFEVSDDELQAAEESERVSLAPQMPAVMRHRPPPPPSMRPRSASTPARAQSQRPAGAWSVKGSQPPRSNQNSSGQNSQPPLAEDPRWLLANRTLELTRAKARCSELEGMLALRDARIAALEQELQQALARSADVGGGRAAQPVLSSARQPQAATNAAPPGSAPQEPPATFSSQEDQAPLSVDSQWPSADEDAGTGNGAAVASNDGDAAEGSEELGRISGIGPVLAKTLRAQGVTRLAQIAAWSEDDIRRIAKAIKVPKSRISRGRWVQKAREALGRRGDESPSST
jgi:predicted flap endonuclease-1-like 5' DNA nuclease